MNKFMKKIMSKKDGFTLVELIVVIAILAILAGIAVPAYSGYINSANEAADTTALGAVKTAVMAAYATEGSVSEIVFTEGSGDLTVKLTGVVDADVPALSSTDFETFYNGEIKDLVLKTGKGATWTVDKGWEITPD